MHKKTGHRASSFRSSEVHNILTQLTLIGTTEHRIGLLTTRGIAQNVRICAPELAAPAGRTIAHSGGDWCVRTESSITVCDRRRWGGWRADHPHPFGSERPGAPRGPGGARHGRRSGMQGQPLLADVFTGAALSLRFKEVKIV